MNDIGYDGVLDVPDEPLGAQAARCPRCHADLEYGDDPDCLESGCPVTLNQQALADLLRP